MRSLIFLLAFAAAHAQDGATRADWPSYGGTHLAWRYSALDQVNTANVKKLAPIWAFQTGDYENGLQSTPIVINGVLYLSTSRSQVFAIDAATGRQIWQYKYPLPRAPGMNTQNRGVAVGAGIVFLGTYDDYMIALDQKTGREMWKVAVDDQRQCGCAITGAPLFVKDKVIVGSTGGDGAFRGYLTAFDAKTGRLAWRFYTVPGPGEKGHETWKGDSWKFGGGATWMTGSFDPALNLVYWGTGGPIPHSEIVRGTGDGAVLYTDSTLALDADTGKIVWYHQFLPRDNWNLDHVFEQVLADIEVDGRPRQVLLTIGKPGIIWALDRRTGEFLWERETSHQTVYKHIDAETGQVELDESLIPQKLDETKFVCPSFYGGKLWMASAYNPVSKTLFVPLNNLCMDYKTVAQEPLPGEDYGRGRMVFRHAPNNNGNIGRVDAIGVENKQTKWSEQRHPYWSSSLLATAGGVVFGGDTNRRIVAFDGGSGKILWELPLNSQPGGFPMTYMAGGKQYVAIPVGPSLIGNRVVRQLTPEIPVPSRGSTLLVFALPGGQRQ